MTLAALVSGSSRGVGRALSLELARAGYLPVLLSRRSTAQQETERLLTAEGYAFESFECDLAERASVAEAAAGVLATLGPPEVVVHSAAVIERGLVAEQDDAAWDRQIEVNLSAPFRLTRALLPGMLARGSGRILFVSSISAVVGSPAQAAYHASKAGLVALMRCLAEEIRDTPLSTTAFLPGSIDTDMLKGSPFPARMSAEEVARTLVFYARAPGHAHNGSVIEMFGV